MNLEGVSSVGIWQQSVTVSFPSQESLQDQRPFGFFFYIFMGFLHLQSLANCCVMKGIKHSRMCSYRKINNVCVASITYFNPRSPAGLHPHWFVLESINSCCLTQLCDPSWGGLDSGRTRVDFSANGTTCFANSRGQTNESWLNRHGVLLLINKGEILARMFSKALVTNDEWINVEIWLGSRSWFKQLKLAWFKLAALKACETKTLSTWLFQSGEARQGAHTHLHYTTWIYSYNFSASTWLFCVCAWKQSRKL